MARKAIPGDAEAATLLLRASILELCALDHQHDPATLERWLANKTPEIFRTWLSSSENFTVLVELEGQLAGVGMLHASGEIRLCYVRPGLQRRGVGRTILTALEGQAKLWNLNALHLESSRVACRFYERCGFVSTGAPLPGFGRLLRHPYEKPLTR